MFAERLGRRRPQGPPVPPQAVGCDPDSWALQETRLPVSWRGPRGSSSGAVSREEACVGHECWVLLLLFLTCPFPPRLPGNSHSSPKAAG